MINISIIGAGNGGQAMAAHFTLLGHKVVLFNRSIEKIKTIYHSKYITLTGAIKGKAKLYSVTTDLEYAIKHSELIMVTTTANAHKEIAHKIAPFLIDNQIVVLCPGRTLGALEFYNEIKQRSNKRIYIAEAQSLIYACRADSLGTVKIIGVKDRVLLSAFPSKDTDFVLCVLNKVFPCFQKAKNILETSLENIGAILHPPVMLFNAAAIERETMFYFYNDMTPSVANFIEQLDNERLKIGMAYNVKLLSVSEWISYAYKGIEGKDLLTKMCNNPAYYKILAPTTLQSRLLLEDIPTGILPMIELAEAAKVEVPLMRSILHIAQVLIGIDFLKNGRTLKNLNIEISCLDSFIKAL